MSDLYERIESLCKELNTNITQMCRESGASRASLTDLKMGRKQTLSTSTLYKIAEYFGVSIDFLLGTEQKEKPTGTTDGQLPFAERREVLAGEGIRILLDADAKLTEEQLDDIVNFIEFQQRKHGR